MLIDDPKKFWGFVSKRRGSTRIPGVVYSNDTVIANPEGIVGAFGDYFSSVYIQSTNINRNANLLSNVNVTPKRRLSMR